MSRQSVLVVEDEPRIAAIAADYLRHAGYDVAIATDGVQGLELARTSSPDLVVLDVRLPKLDGFDVARAIRERSAVPIIMVTARVEEADRLRGLEIGADDYVTKPFSPRELVARVKAVLRRASRHANHGNDGANPDNNIHLGDLVLDPQRLAVTRDRESIDLTATEFRLLALLARHPGRVFTRSQLLDVIRGPGGDDGEAFDRAVDAHVKNLRRKLEADTRDPRYILTVYGVGYKAAE
jgi:two-component system alkaline phosphatase synthesis response regulator PhoP